MRHLYIFILLMVLISGCESEIVLDLDRVEPRLVIEGIVTDQPGPYFVKLSKTTNFYDANEFPPQSGATVILSDNSGQTEQLTETAPGVYATETFQGERGRTYTLEVTHEGQAYSAQSRMPEQRVTLDSIRIKFEEESIFFDEGYFSTAYFNDLPNVDNWYRLNFFRNGEPYVWFEDDENQDSFEDDNFWLWSDKYSDGNVQDFEFLQRLDLGDTVYIELHHIDQPTYDYYRTVVEIRDNDGLAPSNPLSNFGQEALGYFGAFSVTGLEVIVTE